MVLKLIGIAFVTIITSTLIKRQNSEIGTLITIVGGLMISLTLIDEGKIALDKFLAIGNGYNIGSNYILPALKILGIAYLTELASDLAEDTGNKFLSSKIIFGGKICVLIASLSVIKNLADILIGLL